MNDFECLKMNHLRPVVDKESKYDTHSNIMQGANLVNGTI